MRYLFSALAGILVLSLTGPAHGTELDDPFQAIPEWSVSLETETVESTSSSGLPEALDQLIRNDLALQLDERTSVAVNYGLFSLPDQNLQDGLRVVGPSFSIGLRCLFD